MKVGSLVECVDITLNTLNIISLVNRRSYRLPSVGETYIVRGFQGTFNQNILLEEIINPAIRWSCGTIEEGGFYKGRFREIQPPMDLTELLDECIKTTHYATNI